MEEEIIYFYNVKDGKYYQSRYTHRWLNNLQQESKKQKEVIDKLEKKIKVVKQYDFDKVGRYKLLDVLKEVSE